LEPKQRGARPKARNPLETQLQQLQAKNARLKAERQKAHPTLDM
jgi:hypothetical protein